MSWFKKKKEQFVQNCMVSRNITTYGFQVRDANAPSVKLMCHTFDFKTFIITRPDGELMRLDRATFLLSYIIDCPLNDLPLVYDEMTDDTQFDLSRSGFDEFVEDHVRYLCDCLGYSVPESFAGDIAYDLVFCNDKHASFLVARTPGTTPYMVALRERMDILYLQWANCEYEDITVYIWDKVNNRQLSRLLSQFENKEFDLDVATAKYAIKESDIDAANSLADKNATYGTIVAIWRRNHDNPIGYWDRVIGTSMGKTCYGF